MSEYFSHDYNARNDLNMKKLFMGEGLAGIGLYWCLVEMLYEKNGYIDFEYIPIIAFDLRTTEEQVNNVINKYDLFCKNETHFFSSSLLKRLDMRNEKSEKAKNSANARWGNANAMRTHSESNAIKENKIKEKEIKVNIQKECIEKDTTPFDNFISKYSINVDNYSGKITEMDFDLLDKAFSESNWLCENYISLSRICKDYEKIVGGYYKDFTKPKEEKQEMTDAEFLILKGYSEEYVMSLSEEERQAKRRKWEK